MERESQNQLSSIDEFARRVETVLQQRQVRPFPAADHLMQLLTTAFYASIEKEEGEELQFALAYLDDETFFADHDGLDVWSPGSFQKPVQFEVDSVAKLASATNPAYSALVVRAGDQGLEIAGVVRISRASHRLDRRERISGRITPWSCLVVKALAPGRLRVDVNDRHVASFVHGSIRDNVGVHVLGGGRICNRLCDLATKNGLDCGCYSDLVARMLISLFDRGHGGTVIITEDTKLDALFEEGSGYRISRGGTSLREAVQGLEGKVLARYRMEVSISIIPDTESDKQQRLERERKDRDIDRELERLYLLEDATDFAADLASVDGALVLRDDLSIVAFGARIINKEGPENVVHALTGDAKETGPGSPIERCGTRHHSAAGFAYSVPGSVVFVLSKDGQVTAMLRPQLERTLYVWRPVVLM